MTRFARQFGFELLKLFARPRTYLGFIFFLAIELFILLGTQLPINRHRMEHEMMLEGLDLSQYFGGLTVAFQMIAWTALTLGSIYLALVCGDIMSKEVEDGTMRMVLSRPVSRGRILLLKYLACVVYTAVLTLFVVAACLGLSILGKGTGGLVVMAPWEHVTGVFTPGVGLERFGLAAIALAFCLLTISTLGFMFSCLNLKPATATILTLSVYLMDDILRNVPLFSSYRDDFLTHHAGVWQHFFEMDIPWRRIAHSFAYLGTFDLAALAVAALYFFRRDFKS
jgi:ABC-2 type transport system permease protein